MLFAVHQFLWLLLIALASGWWSWHRRVGQQRRVLVACCRFGCLAALAIALSRPMWSRHALSKTTVITVDLSPAMSIESNADPLKAAAKELHDLRGRSDTGDVKLIAFSNRAERLPDDAVMDNAATLASVRARLAEPLWTDDPRGGGSALADALQLAGAEIPVGGQGTIELFSACLATRGDAAAEAYRLANRGISIFTETPPLPSSLNAAVLPTALIRSITAPPTARIGATISTTIAIESQRPVRGALRVTAGDGKPESKEVELAAGINTVQLNLPLHQPGMIPLRAELLVDGATNSIAPLAAVEVGGPTRVMVVSDDTSEGPRDGTVAALQNILGDSAQVSGAAPSAISSTAFGDPDLVVLADVPADHLAIQAQQYIQSAVTQGTGLLVSGAARSFGPGGYDSSAIASMLPVRMPQQMQNIDPSTTLVLIIDTSGSMSVRNKLPLAKEIARMAIGHLRPNDKVGIVEFYGGRRWAAPIEPVANSTDVTRALNRLTAGGGTKLFPAFQEASFALHNVATRTKHVLIISDGDVEDAPFSSLARTMADDGITVSTVACAPSESNGFLPSIAQSGRGHYYEVPDEYELPDVTLKQPKTSMLSPLVETPAAINAQPDPLFGSVMPNDLGTVSGYVRTSAKPMADVLLQASGDPLLARWRFGSGWVAAMPTQLGSTMTNDLQRHRAFATLLSGLIRQISRDHPQAFVLRPKVRPAGIETDITLSNSSPALAASNLRLTLFDEAGTQVREVSVSPIGDGHWNVLMSGVPAGAYRIEAHAETDAANGEAAVAVPMPVAVSALVPDVALLTTIAGFAPLAAQHAATNGSLVSWIDLRHLFTTLAIVFFLMDVLTRRFLQLRRRAT